MDEDVRRGRREEARRRIYRRRRLVAGGLAGLVVGLLVLAGVLLTGGGDDQPEASSDPRPVELPRGGRTILPDKRVVAFYGAPQDPELGELGIGSPARAARKLERQARLYARRGRPVLPAFELIAAIVTSEAGDGGDHSIRQEPATIRRYLRAARAHRMLLMLDVQPGYAPFLQEAKALEHFLKEPDVSLALDPEWSMDPPQLPGQEIGSTDAATINEVSRYLSGIVRRYHLPQKLLVVHRFTGDMIQAEHDLERNPGVALVVNVDGFGDQPNKISKYNEFTNDLQRRFNGFKLFYHEDLNLMKPKQVLRLRPTPDLIVYE
ncbi:MAG TPA: hypothetical protein VK486_05520 [Thermoleophilaceae bacterium]|nr:hypothetical protein [Thermoleophilaceae bacterium]